jgi:two-component system osmolarity sensor histidine kinase EnvZ
MEQGWLKHSMPRGLYGRAALILAVPVLALQVVVSIVFIQRHFEDVTRQMTRGVVLDLGHLLGEIGKADTIAGALARTRDLRRDLDLDVTLPADPPAPPGSAERRFYDISGLTVVATLREELPALRSVDLATSTRELRVQLDTRFGPMQVVVSRRLVTASNPHQFLVIMGVFGIVITLVAYVYLRNQLRPITQLAEAADAFGRGRVVGYRPAGAQEVRAAGAAFLDMRARIERQIEQRTLMLSGISHDLRTPLTRLRLGLSMLEEGAAQPADIADMERDVADMEALIDAFLLFARSGAQEPPAPVRPDEVAARAVENAGRSGGDVRLVPATGDCGELQAQPLALERALGNLIANAVRYARHAEVSVTCTAAEARFTVEDDGPGIPPERRAEAMQPFARLDTARNQDRGPGVGLGLSIARDIARAHGGQLDLGQSERLGGLAATLTIPRAGA